MQAMSTRFTAAQAAVLLREIVAGGRTIRLREARRPWVQVAVGECEFVAGDARLSFFADSATLDHLSFVRLEDGRSATFTDWLGSEGVNPLDLLDEGERLALEHRLHDAR